MNATRCVSIIVASGMLVCAAGQAQAQAGRGAPSGSGFRGAPTSDNETTRELEKGIKALQENRFVDARQAFERVLQTASEDANVNYLAGMSYAGLNDHKNARRYYERALRAKRDHVGAQQQLGISFLKLGDRPKAEAQLTKLKAQEAKCASKCVDAGALSQAIASLTAELANPA